MAEGRYQDGHGVAKLKDGHGVAKLKPEFILRNHRPTVDTEYLSKAVKDQIEETTKDKGDDGGPPSKRIKLKGRNKHRPQGKRIEAGDKLCPAYTQERECSFGGKCKFSHDRKKILDSKAADIGPDCHLYETYGKCPFGITCRFAKSHISEDFKNLSKPDADKMKNRAETVTNILSKDLQHSLWKRRYDFSKSDEVLDKICPFANFQKKRTQTYTKNKAETAKKESESNVEKSGEITNDETATDNMEKSGDAASRASESTQRIEKAPGNVEKSGEITKDETATDNTEKSGDAASRASESTQRIEKAMSNESDDISKNGSDNTDIVDTADGSGLIEKGANGDQGTDINMITDKGCTENVSSSSNIEVVDSKLDVPTITKKKVLFSDKLYLAPLTTVGNLPFRRICKRFGADITCGEMAVCTNLLQGQQSEWALLKRHESEDMFGVQLCGGYPDSMTRCSQLICETMNVDFIDINCGCPIDLIFNKGEGSALMGRQSKFEQIVTGMQSVINVPLTVKLRMGIYDNKNIAHTIVPHLRDWGIAMTTVHGRTRMQRYTKTADWDYINHCAQLACPMPVFGNGDILSYEEANLHQEQTGVSGVMVARGALIKPWIFTEIKEQRHWDISSTERFDMLKDYVNYGLDHWGSDYQGVENTRRFILEWLSFLYRYIPVGVLEHVPQQINDRPPFYKGRDEMETLMASPNCGDWIKISEKLLGPVPDGFSFLPKHKANAYK